MGLRSRKNRNETNRANGNEPTPGNFAGVKRWARYHSRVPYVPKVRNPEKYLHASRSV